MDEIELTILMPCLNEAETIASCISQAKEFLHQEKIKGEILIADNGSGDKSKEIALHAGAKVIDVPTKGYGAALLHGIQFAKGRYIIMGDADASYDFLHLMPFLQRLRTGDDLVMGNRFRGGIQEGAMPFLNKYLGNPLLSFLGRIFCNSKLGDFHCGLRGFKREAILKLNLRATGMEFASEMIVKATLKKLRISEVPTTLSPDGRSRKPHLRPWRDGWRHLRLLLLLSPRWLFLYPGLCLLMLGILLLSILSRHALNLGQFTLDIHSMLFASLFVIVGLQAVYFFIFTRVYMFKQSFYKLESGLLVGLCLAGLGMGGACYSFFAWMQHGFGPLIPTTMMRLLIPSFTFLIAGVQIIFASFFIGGIEMREIN